MLQELGMLSIRNNSDTLVCVIHEIYGINQHIEGVCNRIAEMGYDVVCPDLLDGRPSFSYEQAEEAYQYFINYEGFDASVKRITFLLRQEEKSYQKIILLGYSIGATIAWLCSGNDVKCDGIIGYYGSRIRDYMDVEPKCPALLIFAEEEMFFDPKALQLELNKKEKVEVDLLEGSHGFADPFSEKYSKDSADEAERIIRAFFEGLSEQS